MHEHCCPDVQELHRWLAVEEKSKDLREGHSFHVECKSLRNRLEPKVTVADDFQYIKYVLQTELGLALKKRERCYASMIHFVHLGTQLWQNDWHKYERPGVRVEVWAEIQLHAFTAARVGEYLESTCRAGSGRGLHYRVSVGYYG
jgi:hypothetical protein